MKKTDRELIKNKFGGLCAYSGTVLEDDWQIEHIKPVRRNWWINTAINEENDNLENMVPVQKLINHYKHSLDLELFRTLYLGKLHEKLKKLPKNPKTEKSKRHIEYMRKIADYFGITEDEPFDGVFFFEKYK